MSNVSPAVIEAAPVKTSSPARRSAAVDFWRGLALLMIFVNHIPVNPVTGLTLRMWGFSDAAEIFVFLAGFSAMLAFGKVFENGGWRAGLLRIGVRVWQLFRAHVLLVFALSLVLIVAGQFTDNKTIMQQMNFLPLFFETEAAFLRIVKLSYMPNMTDILPMYILFVAGFPLAWWLMRRAWWLPLPFSGGLWLWANLMGYHMPNYPEGTVWFLNPLAWQFLFVAGMAAAARRDALLAFMTRRRAVWAAAVFTSFAALATAPWTVLWPDYRLIPPEILAWTSKGNLAFPRLMHFAALAVLAARFCRFKRMGWLARAVTRCGAHALPVYCCGVTASLAVYCAVQLAELSSAAMVALTFLGLGGLLLLAWLLERGRMALRQARAVAP